MMKVRLVFAPPESPGNLAEMSEGVMPPLGILSLAATLRDKIPDLDIKVTDGRRTRDLPPGGMPALVRGFRPQGRALCGQKRP